MRRLSVLAVTALALLAAAPAAHGQASSVIVSDGERTVSGVESRARLTGQIVFDFHGDEAAGCAAEGLCGVSGRVIWDPSGPGSLLAYGYRSHGQRFESAFLQFG